MSFSSKKGEFDRCFNGLDPPVEESRPDRPVDPTGVDRSDRFPSLLCNSRLGSCSHYSLTAAQETSSQTRTR